MNCSITSFHIPLKDSINYEKTRFFKLQVDSFYGNGGGLKFLKILGTRLGTVIEKRLITIDASCTASIEFTDYDYNCRMALDMDYGRRSSWFGDGVGSWIKITMPR